MKIPKFLHELINRTEYADKNSDTYARATKEANNMKTSDNGINMLKQFEGSVKLWSFNKIR